MEIPIWLAFILSWMGVVWGIYRLFKEVGETIKDEVKSSTANWLLNSGNISIPKWSQQFTYLFDSLFTKNHWSWKCFFRSILASSIVIGICFIIAFALNIESFEYGDLDLIILISILNLIVDYFSLLETRVILNFMNKSKNLFAQLLFIALDFVLTFMIYIIGLLFLMAIIYKITQPDDEDQIGIIGSVAMYTISVLQPNSGLSVLGMFLYSTFVTSIWIWFYFISGFIIKGISHYNMGLRFLKNNLNIESKPFRSMGLILAIIITILYLVWGISHLYSSL